ncbi:toprim domain-containing protein [Larkinella bovis]|uniref:Toprim domain-containing protein n=1 Tax=Larkinella bovis TaxID=683041 RepID=A0ABW0I8E7_9BACT
MISAQHLDQLKAISIADYLASQGHQPLFRRGSELLYHSPLRDEKTPSFSVNVAKNVFVDFGQPDCNGDVIRLVQLLHLCGFTQAVEYLERLNVCLVKNSFSLSGLTHFEDKAAELIAVKPLAHPALIQYVEKRGIPSAVAVRYLQQVHYQHQNRPFFALGFANDVGGFELRAKVGPTEVKRSLGRKWFTTLEVPGSTVVNLFEGFFDFLSALVFYRQTAPRCTTIILNTTANLTKALPALAQYRQINVYLDRDHAGQNTLNLLIKEGLHTIDRSSIYQNHKDFNEFLTKH